MAKETERRPDPEELLQKIHKEKRGKLTVFLGAAAGVGKTYTMLEAAHERLAEGTRVMIGWVETHGRAETERLVAGLPRIAPTTLFYRGKNLQEMDIDGILAQKPELVLVDELAHTNVSGSRHNRRFQDVEELLNAGIHVYTTLNIQHIESLNDVVAQITGVLVRETVPDSFIDQADSIQLIDIPPEELIKRLKDGKVYVSGQAEQALKKFFRPGNINALRELALRFTAGRVDQNMADYMRLHHIDGPWPAAGRVMVCVSASPFSAQLIRAAHRLAKGLHAEFLAVYVETPVRRFPLGERERDRVWRNLRLAEELGGKIITTVGNDIVQELLAVACNENVTAVVVGKPRHSRWRELWPGSMVDKLIRRSEGINVYVIQSKDEAAVEENAAISTALPDTPAVPWVFVAGGCLMTAAVTAVSWLGRDPLEQVNIALLYLLPVMFSAVWWGRWPSYITAVTSVLTFDYLFVPPVMTFTVSDIRYLWSFVIFLIISFVIGGRTEILRQEVRLTRQRETGVRALYDFSRQIAAVIDLTQIAGTFARHAGSAIGRSTVILLPGESGKLAMAGKYDADVPDGRSRQMDLPDSEYAVANWVFANGQVAGRSTETLPGADYLFVPLIADKQTVGVFGIELQQKITQEERQLIYAWAGLAAVAVERVKLTEAARQAALLKESDQLRTALFNSVSHELKTPLAAITGAVSTLLDAEVQYSNKVQGELLETVKDSAHRMERVVTSLLDTARLESGMLQLKMDWCDVEDIVGAAIRRMGDATRKHVLETRVSPALPLLRADCVLLENVLVNLLDNALKYSPAGSTITIAAEQSGQEIIIAVQDTGTGIPEQDATKIFDKFYRVQNQAVKVAGTGLGLSICKSIVEAHNGRIWAKNGAGGGTIVSFAVPIPAGGSSMSAKADM